MFYQRVLIHRFKQLFKITYFLRGHVFGMVSLSWNEMLHSDLILQWIATYTLPCHIIAHWGFQSSAEFVKWYYGSHDIIVLAQIQWLLTASYLTSSNNTVWRRTIRESTLKQSWALYNYIMTVNVPWCCDSGLIRPVKEMIDHRLHRLCCRWPNVWVWTEPDGKVCLFCAPTVKGRWCS